MKKLALIGSKDFADQIRSYASDTGAYEVVGLFDDYEPRGKIINGLPILGKIADIEKCYKQNMFDCIFCAAGYSNFQFREYVFNLFKGIVPFATILDKTAFVGKNVIIGEGVYLGPYVKIFDNSVIGDNVFIHAYTVISHDNCIGDHTYLAGRIDTAGFCTIGKRNFIGIKVLIADHVSICDDVWIGLGCVVARDIKEPGKYMSPSTKLYKIE